MHGPDRNFMKKDENRVALLKDGQVTQGSVAKVFYASLAPEGWMIIYCFSAQDPESREQKAYWGAVRGPKQYYATMSLGDAVTVIYLPSKPKVNCEFWYFLNNPGYRRTFNEAGKLQLLNKYRKEYRFEHFTLLEWSDQQSEK